MKWKLRFRLTGAKSIQELAAAVAHNFQDKEEPFEHDNVF